ncbi:MAG: undecaprenyl-phosphate glucose phosphotransferase [Planctomycetota bacterium]|nr:undecaprenyl-phosphate glucose phosphotransferase [Planctomycetota bacterium]
MIPQNSLRIRHERSLVDALLRASDAACIGLGFTVAAMYPKTRVDTNYFLAVTITIITVFLIGEIVGLYRSWRGVAIYREIAAAELTWVYSGAALLVVAFFTRFTDHLPRAALLIVVGTVAALFGATRILMRMVQRSMMAKGLNTRKFAIIGVTDLGVRLARNMENAPEFGLEFAGFYDDRPATRTGDVPEEVGDRLGTIGELVDSAQRGEIHRIYITLPMRAEKRIRHLLDQFADSTASVYIVPDFFVFELLHSRWTDIGGLPVVSVFENPFYGVDGMAKRICDVALASMALGAAAIPMLVIAALIKLTSRGPVFFRQKRYGLDGREILVWKFRSMRVADNGPVVKQATQGDPRITPLGRILRKTSLDELPQLFNVLEGNMSLVGPRPHASAHNEQYRRLIPGYMLRHKVKPGITGLAQVLGWRGETDTLDKMSNRIQCDLEYIREWSLWMDLKILFRTVFVVFSQQNAY